MEPAIKLRKFTVQEYDRMVEVGILTKDDKVELMDGEIVYKPTKSPRHAACRSKLVRSLLLFEGKSPQEYDVGTNHPIRLDDYSEVEPDVVIIARDHERFSREHPKVEDTFLLIEVTDLDPERNQRLKLPLYARTGVREMWIVDFPNDVIEVYREPSSEGFKRKTTLRRGDAISPYLFPDIVLSVDEILL